MIGRMFAQSVTVEPFAGEGAKGPLFGAAATVACRVQEAEEYRLGENGSPNRQEVTGRATVVYMPPGTVCPPRSRVTLPSGRVGTAEQVHRRAVPARLAHLEVHVL